VNPIFAAALEMQEFCERQRWRFCFIGALAVQRWGEPRLTLDVDLTVLSGFGAEEHYVDALLERFRARREDVRDFALQHRVVLLESENRVPLDVALGAMPFEECAVARSSSFTVSGGASIRTCSAEDLVVFKVFAGRDKDWLDVEGIVLRQSDRLDEALIWNELGPLLELKQAPEDAARLGQIFGRARRASSDC
jgi:hypothetical protein